MTTSRLVRYMNRSAILLSLSLLFQVLGRDLAVGLTIPPMYESLLVGPLLALCLLVATAFAGVWSGVALALLTPLGSYATGSVSEPLLLPVVALGNLILVLCFAVADGRTRSLAAGPRLALRSIGILSGSVFKSAWLWGGFAVYGSLFAMKPALRETLGFTFGWSQVVTVLVGGLLALLVLGVLERTASKTR